MHHHRAGNLQQKNKGHKRGQHDSKRKLDRRFHGRVDQSRPGKGAHRESVKSLSSLAQGGKAKRFNAAKQKLRARKAEILMARRMDGGEGVPKVVVLLPYADNTDCIAVRDALFGQAQTIGTTDMATTMGNPITASFATYKQRMTVLVPPDRDMTHCLSMARVADVVVFVTNMQDGEDHCIDELGDNLMTAVRAQGMPAVIGVYQGANCAKGKKAAALKKYATRVFQTEFGVDIKIADGTNGSAVLRALATVRPKPLRWRSMRPYLVGCGATIGAADAAGKATLKVCGYLRGRPFNVNRLVHVAGVGTFQVEKVTEAPDAFPQAKARQAGSAGTLATQAVNYDGDVIVAANPSQQEDLRSMAPFDAMAAEQTWPTDDEMKRASVEQARLIATADKVVMRVPKGTSAYQAAWLEGDSGDESDDGGMQVVRGDGPAPFGEDTTMRSAGAGVGAGAGAGASMADPDDLSDSDDMDDDGAATTGTRGDMSEDEGDYEEELKRRRRLAADEEEFPNEVDTPRDIPALERFARYRGLKSFRSTPWNPQWNLPRSYARAYKFKHFKRTQKRVVDQDEAIEQLLRQQEAARLRSRRSKAKAAVTDATATGDADAAMNGSGEVDLTAAGYVPSGRFVVIHIAQVPVARLMARDKATPLVVGGLLKHENRMSVVHMYLSRHAAFEDPIKSKDEFEFHVGWRQFDAAPIYSRHNPNMDKHKFERFFPHGKHLVASAFAPVCYSPTTVLMFKRFEDGSRQLVATGTVMSVDPDRIILKETMLTGLPVKVKNKNAVVKYMFFNADDVRYFKPIELRTKYGMHGHIREPLGTHGQFKCVFNRAIKQQDTVCLSLYKRVFPKIPDVDADDMEFATRDGPNIVRAAKDPSQVVVDPLASALAAAGNAHDDDDMVSV